MKLAMNGKSPRAVWAKTLRREWGEQWEEIIIRVGEKWRMQDGEGQKWKGYFKEKVFINIKGEYVRIDHLI